MINILRGAALLCFVSATLHAGTTGKIAGRVIDKATGEALIGVNTFVQTTARGASTDADGFYSIINVPPGKYTLVFQMVGYSKYIVKDVVVSVDRTTRIDAQLTEEKIQLGEVVVQAERPPVQMDRTYSASIVNSDAIEAMPVNAIREVLQLQPGVVNSGGALHFRGGREREVAYLIDGLPVSNVFNQAGGSNVQIENSMIEELEVISGTFNAEYGAAQSGVINIVTKGIASDFSANLALYTGEWLSNHRDVFLGIENVNPFSERDIQFGLSGPIVADRLGFSVSGRYNKRESLEWYEKRFTALDGWKIAAYRRWIQEQRSDETSQSQAIYIPDSLKTGDGSRGPLAHYDAMSLNAKLNYRAGSGVEFGYQVFGSRNTRVGSASTSRRYQPDESGEGLDWAHSHFLTAKLTPSKNIFINVGASYQYNTDESYYRKDNKLALFPGDDGVQPITASADGFSLGSTSGFYTSAQGKNFKKMILVSGDINWQVDSKNLLKAGIEYKHHTVNTYSWGFIETPEWQNNQFPRVARDSTLTFARYWEMLNAYWRAWEDSFHTTRYRRYGESEYTLWRDYTIRPRELAAYVQDKVELGEIILNAGLRFDMFIPNEVVPINNRVESFQLGSEQNLVRAKNKVQFSPRFGVSFPVSAVGVFHAAYGHFFQMPSFEKMFNEPFYVLTPLQLDGRIMGNASLEPEKTIQYEIGLQQELVPGIAVDVTAYYKDMRNLLGLEYVTTVDNIRYLRYINRDYGNSKGITVGVRKNVGLITGGINYSYSTANGSASSPEEIEVVQSSVQIGGEPVEFVDRQIIPLNWDQRHTVNANITYASESWSVGVVGFFWSGQPYSPTFVEKFDILEQEYQNAASKPFRWSIDLKAQKMFEIGGVDCAVFLKVENLLDNFNENNVYASTGTASAPARLPEVEQLERQRLLQENLFTLGEIDNRAEWYSSPRKVQLGFQVRF